jgi:hypothetical protein
MYTEQGDSHHEQLMMARPNTTSLMDINKTMETSTLQICL